MKSINDIKATICKSKTVSNKVIKDIILLGDRHDDPDMPTVAFLVVTIKLCDICEHIPYVYRACYYVDHDDIAFTDIYTGSVSWN